MELDKWLVLLGIVIIIYTLYDSNQRNNVKNDTVEEFDKNQSDVLYEELWTGVVKNADNTTTFQVTLKNVPLEVYDKWANEYPKNIHYDFNTDVLSLTYNDEKSSLITLNLFITTLINNIDINNIIETSMITTREITDDFVDNLNNKVYEYNNREMNTESMDNKSATNLVSNNDDDLLDDIDIAITDTEKSDTFENTSNFKYLGGSMNSNMARLF